MSTMKWMLAAVVIAIAVLFYLQRRVPPAPATGGGRGYSGSDLRPPCYSRPDPDAKSCPGWNLFPDSQGYGYKQ